MRSESSLILSSIKTIFAVAFILLLSGPPVFAAAAGAPLSFPKVEGVNLDNVAQVLPRDFKGRLNLILMAFQRGQQSEVDTWLTELHQMSLGWPDFDYYELPVIGPTIAPLRWIIRKGMGSKITEPEKRLRTILIFTAKDPLLKPLAIASEETIVVLLLDEKGRLLWRSAGAWNEEEGESLRQTVETFQAALPR
jgi:hypothetical protein